MNRDERAGELIKGVKVPSWDRYNKFGDSLPVLEQLAWVKNFRDKLIKGGIGKKLKLSEADLARVERDYDLLISLAEEQVAQHHMLQQAFEKETMQATILGRKKKGPSELN